MTNKRYINDRDAMLNFIVAFKRRHNGIAPSRREIRRALDMSSTSVVAYHLDQLAEAGLITFPLGRGVTRAIGVPGYEFREAANDKESA